MTVTITDGDEPDYTIYHDASISGAGGRYTQAETALAAANLLYKTVTVSGTAEVDRLAGLLFEDGASPAADPDLVNGAVGEIFADAIKARRRWRAGPGPVVNLRHDRGPIPASVHATFRELCRQPRIHNLLESLDELIEPLKRSVAPGLEAARREVAALREREVTPERLGETGGPDSADERTERVARTYWTIQRRLRRVGEPLGWLDCAGMKITPSPSAFRRFLEQVEEHPAGNMPEEGLVARCDEALRGFEQAAGEAVRRIRAVADARRQVERDAWNDTALRRIRHVLQRVEEAQQVLDDDTLPDEKFEIVREGLKEEDSTRPGGWRPRPGMCSGSSRQPTCRSTC